MQLLSAGVLRHCREWRKGRNTENAAQTVAAALILFVMLVAGTVASVAQSFTAAITGTVTDQSGAVVSGARVEIRNTETNELRVLTSDANGQFTSEQLPPGQYQLTVSASGFKAFVKSGIVLVGSQRAEHNAQLELGSTAQSVEVNAAAVAIDTQTANREVTIPEQEVQGLPTGFRN